MLSSVGHCATVIATNALRLVTRSGAFDFAGNFDASPKRQDHTASPYAYFGIGRHHGSSPLATNAPIGFAHSGDLDVAPDTFGVHRIPPRVS